MKKIFPVLIIALVAVIPAVGTSSRHSWWQGRVQSLQKDREKLSASGAGDKLLALIDLEIADSRQVVRVLEGGTSGSQGQQVAPAAIDPGSAAGAVTALLAMEELGGDRGGKDFSAACQSLMERDLDDLIRQYFGRDDINFRDGLLRESVSAAEKKTILLELYLGMVMNRFPGRMEKAAGIARSAAEDMKGKADVPAGEVSLAVTDRVLRGMSEGGAEPLVPDGKALRESWTWNRIRTLAEGRFAQYRNMMALGESLRTVSLDRVRYYHENPSGLEEVVFPSDSGKENAPVTTITPVGETDSVLGIPAMPDFARASLEVDNGRRNCLSRINGRETEAFFNRADGELAGIVDRHVREALAVFTAGEERIRRSSGDRKDPFANTDLFRLAHGEFSLRYGRLVARKNRSMDLLHLVSAIRGGQGSQVAASCRYQEKRLREYLDFCAGLTERCAAIPGIDSNGILGRRFVTAQKKMEIMIPYFNDTLSLEGRYITPHPGAEGDMALLKKNGKEYLAASALRMRQGKAAFARSQKEAGRRTQAADRDPAGSLQAEIGALSASVARHAALAGELTATDRFLDDYAGQYALLEDALRQGEEPEEMARVLKEHSLLGVVSSYDEKAISRERADREYLRREGLRQVARLVTLKRDAKTRGFDTGAGSTDRDVQAWRMTLEKHKSVKVGSWRMDEGNIADVDARAAAQLERMSRRDSWRAPSGGNETPVQLQLGDAMIRVNMPRGWTRMESSPAGEACFASPDGQGTITFARIGGDKPSLVSCVEERVRRTGSPVMKRHGKSEGGEYYYMMSRGRKGETAEVYGRVVDGSVFLLCGETSRNKAKQLSSLLRGIFDGAQFGGGQN